jgi:peptide/nickel transport system substrate-binding protein
MRKIFLPILILSLALLAGCVPPTTGGPAAVTVESEPAQPAAEQAVEPAAAQPEAAAPEPVKGGRLVRAMTSEPAAIDPQGAASSGLSLVMPYLFDTLVTRDADGSLHPLLAESWVTSDDGTAITMKLKPGVTFHDGSPLNAEAVKLTFDRYLERGTKSPIYGAVKEIGAVEVIDDLTVRFTFDQPSATFWSTVTMPYAGILSPASMAAVDASGEGNLVGTGPFMLGEWKAGQSLTLVANPAYAWGADFMENQGAPYLSELVFKVIPEATTQMAALEVGEVDVIFVNQPSHMEKLAAHPELRTEQMVLNSLIYLGFNSQKGPFAEPLVRQALSHAVDKQQILDIALGGLGQLAYTPLPPTLLGFDPALKQYELGYDPDKARELLQEAGFEATAGGWQRDGQPLSALLLTSNRAPNEAIATLLQSQLKAIGVPVEIQQLDSRAVQDATNQGAFDLLLWRFEWNDPDGLRIFLGTEAIGSTNRTFYSNPDVDALLAQAAHELDPAARHDLYVQAQQLILQDAPWQPLYNPVDVMAARETVQGVKIGYMGRMLVNDAFVEQ